MGENTFFARCYVKSESGSPSAEGKDFNLRRVLFSRGNQAGLFQHNRPKAARGQANGETVICATRLARNGRQRIIQSGAHICPLR